MAVDLLINVLITIMLTELMAAIAWTLFFVEINIQHSDSLTSGQRFDRSMNIAGQGEGRSGCFTL